MKLSVVIPARNEAGNIGPTLDALRERLARDGIAYELVVVDDGSHDTTGDVVISARSRADNEVDRLTRIEIRGRLGRRAACAHSQQHRCHENRAEPGPLERLAIAASPQRCFYILRDRAECAFGSRFVPGGQVENYPRFKLVVNRLANFFVRVLFRLRYNDVTNAFKAYRAEVIEGCRPLIAPHFNLTVELPLKAIVRGYSYETVPISWRQRKRGTSSLYLQEMGSRYLFIVLYVWLEKMLTRGDYRRPAGQAFEPFLRAASRR